VAKGALNGWLSLGIQEEWRTKICQRKDKRMMDARRRFIPARTAIDLSQWRPRQADAWPELLGSMLFDERLPIEHAANCTGEEHFLLQRCPPRWTYRKALLSTPCAADRARSIRRSGLRIIGGGSVHIASPGLTVNLDEILQSSWINSGNPCDEVALRQSGA